MINGSFYRYFLSSNTFHQRKCFIILIICDQQLYCIWLRGPSGRKPTCYYMYCPSCNLSKFCTGDVYRLNIAVQSLFFTRRATAVSPQGSIDFHRSPRLMSSLVTSCRDRYRSIRAWTSQPPSRPRSDNTATCNDTPIRPRQTVSSSPIFMYLSRRSVTQRRTEY